MLTLCLKTALGNGHVQIKDDAYPQRDGSLLRRTDKLSPHWVIPV